MKQKQPHGAQLGLARTQHCKGKPHTRTKLYLPPVDDRYSHFLGTGGLPNISPRSIFCFNFLIQNLQGPSCIVSDQVGLHSRKYMADILSYVLHTCRLSSYHKRPCHLCHSSSKPLSPPPGHHSLTHFFPDASQDQARNAQSLATKPVLAKIEPSLFLPFLRSCLISSKEKQVP